MEIRHLRLIKTVAEEGNLTSAGRKLFLTQSALSHQLREMEEKFGTSLFQRIGKKMILTQAGERLLATAKKVLTELEKTEYDVKKLVSGESGVLRISTECYTCYHWLPALLKSYRRWFPNVDVQIVTEATRQPIQFLLNGKLDLAIVSCLTRQDEATRFKYAELFTDEMVVVAHAGHRFASQDYVYPEQLTDEHLICYTAPTEFLDIFQRVLIPAGITPGKVSKLQLTEAIIEMVKSDLGITVIANWAIKPYLRSKKLAAIPLAGHALERVWYAVTINGDQQPRFVDCFVKHLQKRPLAKFDS
ncbi:LysR family transcriptional regulator [candidate division KSB1 bacterium]|nr:LysR family transcriptional regulator [candidate division KSB1 bacterium]NIV92363.1 LysR family transcriptional regulator [candidate division KSB1 bacterium]